METVILITRLIVIGLNEIMIANTIELISPCSTKYQNVFFPENNTFKFHAICDEYSMLWGCDIGHHLFYWWKIIKNDCNVHFSWYLAEQISRNRSIGMMFSRFQGHCRDRQCLLVYPCYIIVAGLPSPTSIPFLNVTAKSWNNHVRRSPLCFFS